jgi:ADP-heptose:LPS heptosyltransferase
MPAPHHLALISDKQLGDVTLLEPACRLLAQRSGQAVAMHVKAAFQPLVQLMPHACWGPEQTQRPDVSWTTSWSSRVVKQSWQVRARQRHLLVNQPRHLRWWYRLFFHQRHIHPITNEYWAAYFWRVLGGDPQQFSSPQLDLPPDDWRHPDLPSEPYILINPTAAWPIKYWLADRWAELLRTTTALRGNTQWVMTGGDSEPERQHCTQIRQALPPELLFTDLSGRTSLRGYLHAISRAQLVLCVDGSASHLAQAFGVPTLTLFGPVHPVKWHWPTPQHLALSAHALTPERPSSSEQIRVEAVMRSLQSFLA